MCDATYVRLSACMLIAAAALLAASPASAQKGDGFDFATYLGGSAFDGANSVAEDAEGRLVAVGSTLSDDFPLLNAAQNTRRGVYDAFITKMDPEAESLVYSTLLGGTATDFAVNVVTDPEGNAYVVGTTYSSNFPVLNAMQPASGGGDDAFVAKYAPDGTLLFSTYLGGSGDEEGLDIALDDAGNVYVSGTTRSTDFPTIDAVQAASGGGADAFVARLSADGSELAFATYLGGSGDEAGNNLTVDPSGEDIFVTGDTQSDDFATQGRTDARAKDAFVAAVRRSATLYSHADVSLLWDDLSPSDLDGDDTAWSIQAAITSSGELEMFITGETGSSAFPTSADAFQAEPHPNDNIDAFVAMVDPTTLEAGWTSIVGGVGNEICRSVDHHEPYWSFSCETSSFTILPGYEQEGNGRIVLLTVELLEVAKNAKPKRPRFKRLRRVDMGTPNADVRGSSGRNVALWITFGLLIDPAIATIYAAQSGGTDAFVGRFAEIPTPPPPPPPPEPLPIALTAANYAHSGTSRDPVNTFTGELFFSEPPDIEIDGPLPLRFSRTYASFLHRDERVEGALGANWSHTFDGRLIEVHVDTLEVVSDRGRVTRFAHVGGEWEQISGRDLPLQLIEDAAAYRVVDPRMGFVRTFDADGRLTSVADGRGNEHVVTYAGDRLDEVSDGLGAILRFAYDGDRLVEVTDLTRTVSFEYTDDLLRTATDILGNTTVYAYDDAHEMSGLLVSTVRPRGNTPYTQTYDDAGRVASQTDAGGNTYTFAYANELTTVTDPLGQSTVHEHTDSGELIGFTDEEGRTIRRTFGERGRPETITDRAGGITTYEYHEDSGERSSITLADGSATTATYDSRTADGLTFYQPEEVTFPDGTSTRVEYDADGNLTRLTDRGGHVWSSTHNGRGQVLTATHPEGGATSFTYHADGTRATVMTPAGDLIGLGYDQFRRRTSVSLPGGGTRTRTLDAYGRVLTETDEMGRTTTYSYDLNGNLTGIASPSGAQLGMSYDQNDRLIQVVDPMGSTFGIMYDARGNVSSYTDANGGTIRLDVDGNGLVRSLTDPAGGLWTATFDALKRLTALTTPQGNTSRQSYDAADRVTEAISPLGMVSAFTYDGAGNLTSIGLPTGSSYEVSFDGRGAVTGFSMPEGIAASFEVNGLGKRERIADASGAAWTRTYDQAGRLASTVDPLGNRRSYAYGARNRVSRVDLPLGSAAFTYDAVGNVLSASYSDGLTLGYAYDDDDRLTSAEGIEFAYNTRGNLTHSNGFEMQYDAGSRITGVTWPTGETVTYVYDPMDRPVEIRDWLGGVTTFAYDAEGRLTSIIRPNGVATTYSYDAAGRMVGIEESGEDILASVFLTRDALGNVVSATRSSPLAPALDAEERSFAFDGAGQVSSYTYDAAGRLLADGTRTYTWDLASRLTALEDDHGSVTFSYDAFGNRTARSAGAVAETFVWNYAFSLPAVGIAGSEGNVVRYVHAPSGDLLYSVDSDGSRHYHHFDERGNTNLLTDDAGAVRTAFAYTPYGWTMSASNEPETRFTFGGKYGVMREGDGLFLMGRRYYDSRSGRFISRDPIDQVDPQALNPYTYAAQNPMQFADPLGTVPIYLAGSPDFTTVTVITEVVDGDEASSVASGISASSFVVGSVLGGLPTSGWPEAPGGILGFVAGTSKSAPTPSGGVAGAFKANAVSAAKAGQEVALAGDAAGGAVLFKDAKDLSKTGTKIGKVAKGVNAAGNVATVVGVSVALHQTSGRVNNVEDNAVNAAFRSANSHANAVDNLIRAFKDKKISREEFERRYKQLNDLNKARLEAADWGLVVDLGIEGLSGLLKSGDALLPSPVSISDAFVSLGGYLFGTPSP